ncbi:hypothetical protein HL667_32085 [Bradyrhizobium sp. 83012]|uniref:Uncharacterized protein n=1 Tax=Bradyrhizobium aeschynomenes TaxID=2734909 RepID=A0ABX2CNH4_9BRAD|nr:hypothetical protein [Bradyrhizobium aeschynomenes]NPU69683.1 hypothetical protein [Bradyrhizobium aeschynomenes]
MVLDPASPALGLNVGSSDGGRPAFFASGESAPAAPIEGASLLRTSFDTSADGADVICGSEFGGCGTDAAVPAALAEPSGLGEPGAAAETPASEPAVAAVDVAGVFASGLLLNRSVELDGAGLAAAPAAAAD